MDIKFQDGTSLSTLLLWERLSLGDKLFMNDLHSLFQKMKDMYDFQNTFKIKLIRLFGYRCMPNQLDLFIRCFT